MNTIRGLLRRVGRCFVAGVFAVLPLVITVGIVLWVAAFVSRMIGPGTPVGEALTKVGLRLSADSAAPYVLGWAVVLVLIFALGVLVEAGARRFLGRWFDGAMHRIPLMGGVYGTAKQLVSMLDRKRDSDMSGMRVVYCTLGGESGAVLLALLVSPDRFMINEAPYHAIMVPTAPVPVGGGLVFVPADAVREAPISLDAFMSIYVSMGVTARQFLPSAGAAPG